MDNENTDAGDSNQADLVPCESCNHGACHAALAREQIALARAVR